MAKKNFTQRKTLTTEVSINGVLSTDATKVMYIDENGIETTILLTDVFNPLAGCDVKLTGMVKCEEDIEDTD